MRRITDIHPEGTTAFRRDPKTGGFYRSWSHMKSRCTLEGDRSKYYKELDISFCKRWELFVNFYEDMFTGWKPGLLLDRIDSSKGYNKENCRWVSAQESNRNRSNTLTKAAVEQIKIKAAAGSTSKELREEFRVNRTTLFDILNNRTWK